MLEKTIAAGFGGIRKPAQCVLRATAFLSLLSPPAFAGDTTTVLEASKASSVFSETVTLTATVTGTAPSGTVRFRADGKSIGSKSFSGRSATYAAVVPGSGFTCALLTDGSVQCWGSNTIGQLGDGTTESRLTPAPVIGLSGSVTQLSSKKLTTCALIDDGSVQCWGQNDDGQLGTGSTDLFSAVPVSPVGLAGTVVDVSVNQDHACALIEGGAVQCWGRNPFGQLGDGTTENSLTPVSVTGLSGPATAIATDSRATCALIDDGSVQCWGLRFDLGADADENSATPVDVLNLAGEVEAIVAGDRHFCVLIKGGATVQCWGLNDASQTGTNGSTKMTPVTVANLDDVTVTAISAGLLHTCALTDSKGLRCWGHGGGGGLGDGTEEFKSLAVDVVDLGGPVAGVGPGHNFTCAILEDGSLQCWGFNESGQLGDGTTTNRLTPVDAFDPVHERTASLTLKDLDGGTHDLTALYFGNPGNSASEALRHTVSKADTTIKKIKISPKTPKAGKTAKATVKVKQLSPATAKPDGKMKVVLDGKTIANVSVKNGKASFKLPKLGKGKSKLKVAYKGTGNFAKSTDKTTFKVKKK